MNRDIHKLPDGDFGVQKTRHEILDEIASVYTSETRSVNDKNKCMYKGNNGRKCAFARMVREDKKHLLKEGDSVMDFKKEHSVDYLLKPEYKGYPVQFYQDCQNLHDSIRYWDIHGLNKKGKIKLKELKETWR